MTNAAHPMQLYVGVCCYVVHAMAIYISTSLLNEPELSDSGLRVTDTGDDTAKHIFELVKYGYREGINRTSSETKRLKARLLSPLYEQWLSKS